MARPPPLWMRAHCTHPIHPNTRRDIHSTPFGKVLWSAFLCSILPLGVSFARGSCAPFSDSKVTFLKSVWNSNFFEFCYFSLIKVKNIFDFGEGADFAEFMILRLGAVVRAKGNWATTLHAPSSTVAGIHRFCFFTRFFLVAGSLHPIPSTHPPAGYLPYPLLQESNGSVRFGSVSVGSGTVWFHFLPVPVRSSSGFGFF